MSKSVTLTTGVTVEVRIYDCACRKCKTDLEFTAETDHDGDLRITVEPCPGCIEEAVIEAKEAA